MPPAAEPGSSKPVSAGCPAIAPFKERLTPCASTTKASTSRSTSTPKPTKAAHATSTSHAAVSKKSGKRHNAQQAVCRGLSAARAVAKVAAADAAVSAAAIALIPSKGKAAPPSPHTSTAGNSNSNAQQQHQLGPQHKHAADHVAAGTAGTSGAPRAGALEVQGRQTGPHRGGLTPPPGALCRPAAGSVAGAASCADPSTNTPPPLHASSSPAPAAAKPAAASAQPLARLDTSFQQLLQALPLTCSTAPGASSSRQPCASAQLAAHGLCKRIKARLQSAHGPPPFQRGPPPPQPASPRPIELTAEMLMRHSPGATSPADVAMADLSSCYISRIAAASSRDVVQSMAAGTAAAAAGACLHAVAPAGDEQLSLQSFSSLVALELSDNRLQCFAGLAVVSSLQQLNLSANRLQSLQGLQQVLASGRHSSTDGQQEHSVSLQEGSCSSLVQLQEPSNSGLPEGPCEGIVSEAPAAEQQLPHEPSAGQQQSQEQCGGGEDSDAPGALPHGEGASTADHMDAPAEACLQQQQQQHTGGQAGGFSALEVLDLSYNMLCAEQLLGLGSPLGQLPRLSELYAAGSGIAALPAQLACFSSLTLLSLQHNQLQLVAIQPLGQLPALQQLDVSHNPLTCPPEQHAQVGACDTQAASAAAGTCFPELQVLDLSYSRLKQLQPLQQLLRQMQRLAVLRLVHTPLANRCRAGKMHEQDLQRPGLMVVMSSGSSGSARQHHLTGAPVLKIPEAASSQQVLAAASRAALVALPHEQLVAAFDRVAADISNWQQLAPVPEEDGSWEGQEGSAVADNSDGVPQGAAGPWPLKASGDEERVVDKTFLTGVGITGELPGDEASSPDATSSQAPTHDQLQDPTERLAVALGLQVSQLAHMTGCTTGNPDGALHRLRHALTHPLVDPDAGERPEQHHMRSTAATAAKQQPPRLVPLPQPISSALSTRVAPVQDVGALLSDMRGRLAAMQGTLLPQLQAKASQMTQPSTGAAGTVAAGSSAAALVKSALSSSS